MELVGIKKVGFFWYDGVEFIVYRQNKDVLVSCEYTGLIQLSGWKKPVQTRAKEVAGIEPWS